MLDVNTPLRKAYFNVLNGITASIGGIPTSIPFYDQVTSGASYPYIYTVDTTLAETFTKDTFGGRVTFTIQVAMKYPSNYGGNSDIDNIVTVIKPLIVGLNKGTYPLAASLLPNFSLLSNVCEMDRNERQEGSDGVYFFRILRFSHIIQQFKI